MLWQPVRENRVYTLRREGKEGERGGRGGREGRGAFTDQNVILSFFCERYGQLNNTLTDSQGGREGGREREPEVRDSVRESYGLTLEAMTAMPRVSE